MQTGCSTIRPRVRQVEATLNPFNTGIDTIQPIRHAHISIPKRTERQLRFVPAHVLDRATYMKKMHHNFIVGLGHLVRVSRRQLQGDHDQVEP